MDEVKKEEAKADAPVPAVPVADAGPALKKIEVVKEFWINGQHYPAKSVLELDEQTAGTGQFAACCKPYVEGADVALDATLKQKAEEEANDLK